jgi:hypothetical protein
MTLRSKLVNAGIALCTLALAGCIDSSEPILTDSQQLFGARLRVQLFTLRDGRAHDPERAVFVWRDGRYVHAGGAMREVAAFSVSPFENGDCVIQETPRKRPGISEYALLHKIADGVYQVLAIDEEDADAPTRAAHCGKGTPRDPAACRIKTREQLLAFARATAVRRKQDGDLALVLPVEAEPKKQRRR